MTISIVVEDGTVVVGANSFVSLSDFKIHCDNRARVYTAVYNDETIKASLIKMADYLNSLPYFGFKTDRPNPMSWPRYGNTDQGLGNWWNQLRYPLTYFVGVLDRDGYWIGLTEIPKEVIDAQCEGAWLILTGKDLEPSLDRGGQLIREKYDVIEFQYANGAPVTTEFKAITNRLKGLLKSSSSMDISRG
jgi:hypothetical protein